MTLPYYVVPEVGHISWKVHCAAHVVAEELKLDEAKALAKALNDTAQRAADTK
jgi:hypothetical protein